jgi:hypothetical protein
MANLAMSRKYRRKTPDLSTAYERPSEVARGDRIAFYRLVASHHKDSASYWEFGTIIQKDRQLQEARKRP